MAKAALQQAFSHAPRGADLNYLFQRHVTRTLPLDGADLDLHVLQAVEHVRRYQRSDPLVPLEQARFFEFGAGWDLLGPVLLYGLGVPHQTVVDIRPHARVGLVNAALATYTRRRQEFEQTHSVALRPLPVREIRRTEDLELLGVRYLAPCDARDTRLPAGSFDAATSTFTLEHVPADDIAAILRETQRLVAPGGVISSMIDLQDHYSYFDASVSVYGYLQYSDRLWRLLNPDLHFQNRLRYPEYRQIFEQAGLELLEEQAHRPSAAELAELREMSLAPRFRGFSLEDLGVRWISFVARSRRSGPAGPAHATDEADSAAEVHAVAD